MAKNETFSDDENEGPPGEVPANARLPFAVRLRTLKSSRATLARIIRLWGFGLLDDATAKVAAWLLQTHLALQKAELDSSIEDRLKALETKILGAK